jgi:hypothetical protein
MSPNLFGEVDADDIPEDPFYISPGTYNAIVTDATFVVRKDGTGHGLSIKYQIDDPDSEYDGNTVQEWKNIYPELAPEDMTPEIKRHLSFVKQRLGQLGVPSGEMNAILDNLDSLVGIKCVINVTETTAQDGSRTYTNVRNVYVPEDETVVTPEN